MGSGLFPPTDDWVFKQIFGEERNASILIDFLKAIIRGLPDDEYELEFLDTHLNRETEMGKMGILDVRVRTKAGKVINVEIQVEPMHSIGQRLSFYKSKLVAAQIAKGGNFAEIQRVICVCIVSRPLFPGAIEYLNRFRFINDENGLCFESIPEEIYTLELSKLPKASDGSEAWNWSRFLAARTEEEFMAVAARNLEIQRALESLQEMSLDPGRRAEYDARQKALLDYSSQMHCYFNSGMERGRAEGMEKGMEKAARNALAKGYTLEQVREITGLDIEAIKNLG